MPARRATPARPGASGTRRPSQRIEATRRAPTSYDRIYAIVRRIPRGRVATYGQIATLAGLPHAPRVAGYAMFHLPPGSPLPWHRVVGAGGRLTLARLDAGSAFTQRLKLEAEGVAFGPAGHVRMKDFAWVPGARRRAGTRAFGTRPRRRG